MKSLSFNLDFKIKQSFCFKLSQTRSITEQQILQLQDLFLSNGIHYIMVPSLKEGRALMYRFLDALRCHQSAACFTFNATLAKRYVDLRKQMRKKNWDSYLCEDFKGDFIWIEQDLLNLQESLQFEKKLCDLGFDQCMPIIILSAY